MSDAALKGKALNDVHKAVFLCNEYQDKTIREVATLLELSAMDINNALWRAEDLGYITVDQDKRTFKVEKLPEWDLGEEVQFLKEQLVYTFNHMARSEADVEENYLANMTRGYAAQDLTIAMKQLLAEGVLSTYELTNETEMPLSKKQKGRGEEPKIVRDTYTFYCLTENKDKEWGRKQFKNEDRVK